MMHEAGRKVSERLRGMTHEERMEYWRRQTEALRREQARLRAEAEARGQAAVAVGDTGATMSTLPTPDETTAEEDAAYLAERMEELAKFEARMRATLEERVAATKA